MIEMSDERKKYYEPLIGTNIMVGLVNYVERHIEPGDFLRNVLENDLQGTFAHADKESLKLLPLLCKFIFNVLPMSCHGSKERVNNWLKDEEE